MSHMSCEICDITFSFLKYQVAKNFQNLVGPQTRDHIATFKNLVQKFSVITMFLSNKIYSTGASYRSFHPIFNNRFGHLETLLTICRPKKVLSTVCRSLGPSPQSKCPKRTFCYPKSIML